MDNASAHTINLANSIIGVSILAMPYCFRQCGILLSIFLLLISSIISRLACHFLLKSAILARRKTFEFLAFHIFGGLGKFSIEIGMIGFLLGTCIAFFVVMGDLGPAILSEMTGVHIGSTLRNSTLIALAVFCVLPLGLLRNVDSLNGVSTATIGFYCCLVLKIVIEALPHIFTGDWVSEVVLWRPAGILQCLPIFSMALFCQTQLFEIYQALPNASLEKMNGMIRVAVNMCTWVYIFVGAFGYIAFFQKPFTGNILLSFIPSVTSDVIKMGFVLSLAFSFPLVIFPCRASLYSLLYKGTSYVNLHEGGTTNYIPEGKFKLLTVVIVAVSLTIGIMIPNIELVLGLIGSTIGVMICVLFPVTCFICISPKNTNERILAQIMLFVGVIVMVLGTYANLQAVEEAHLNVVTEKVPLVPENPVKVQPEKPVIMDLPTTSYVYVCLDGVSVSVVRSVVQLVEILLQSCPDIKLKLAMDQEKKQNPPDEQQKLPQAPPVDKKIEDNSKEVRHEPPQPEEPLDNQAKPKTEINKNEEVQVKQVEDKKDKQGPVVEPVQPPDEKEQQKEEAQKVIKEAIAEQKPVEVIPEKKEEVKKKNEEVDIEAIKKEDKELKEDKAEEDRQENDRNQILIDTIQKQNEVQKEIVEQQKKLLEVIQKHQDQENADKVNEEKVKAVKQIEDIAKRAIESIRGEEKKNILEDKPDEKDEHRSEETVPKSNVKTPDVTNVVKEEVGKISEESKVKINDTKMDSPEKKTEQARPNEIERKNASKIAMVPLPLALAQYNNANVTSNEKPSTNNVKNADNNSIPKNEDSDVKAMRRDILSEKDQAKVRAKREVDDDDDKNKMENLSKAVKEVCDEISKSTSTEKPVIKMLCKLSEPNLQTVDLGMMDEKERHVQPQRDLKQFSEQ